MGNVSVPSSHTTYYCKLFPVPYFNDTQHVVRFSAIIEEGNEAVVHHMVVFDCPEYIASNDHDVFEGDCDDDSINMPSRQCRGERTIFAWAVGGATHLYMPEDAGMPISGESSTHYILIEMHYDVC